MLLKLVCLTFILQFGNNYLETLVPEKIVQDCKFNLELVCSSENDLPEIDTPLGRVRGFWKTLNDQKYAAFEGIPYAKPPTGDLRFEAPEPIPAWSGIWEANYLKTCLQGQFFTAEKTLGQEDCLYLNVYVPASSVKDPNALDVIVAIHGGAFMLGNGHLGLNTFLEKDVVLVSINYRVGILGFLSTEDDAIPGNNGMKDQSLALKWVKDNIASFGGNPHSVTIVGQSAGGASVHLHYFSPLSKGLFAKGLSQSGSAIGPWVIRKNALARAKKLAVLVGCPDSPSEELKKCLKQRPAHNLLNQLDHFYGFQNLPFSPFAPVVEKASENAFLEAEPFELLKEGKVLDVPWITSFTRDEGLLSTAFLWEILEEVDEKWTKVAPELLDYNDTLPESKREIIAKEVLDYYLGPGEKIDKKNFQKLTQIFTDRFFAVSAELAAKLQAKVTKSPVYFYLFNYREGENKIVNFYSRSGEVEGVGHAEDNIYFYGTFAPKPYSEQDKRLVSACHNMLYSYANSGNPSFDGTDIWQPTGSEELTYLLVNGPDDLTLKKIEVLTPIDFWSKLGLLENENLGVKDEL